MLTDAPSEAPAQEYLRDTVRAWLGLPASSGIAVPELPPRLARLLLRVEEYERGARDQWGCWEHGLSENYRDGRLWVPEIDLWVDRTRRELAGRAPLEPLWPDGKRFAVSLTHDVDLVSEQTTPRQVLRSVRASLGGPVSSRRERALRPVRPAVRIARSLAHGVAAAPAADELQLCVELEREHGVPASYFFTVFPRSPSRYDCLYRPDDRCRFRGRRTTVAGVLQALAAEGFDVGLHGSYHSGFEPGVLAAEKEALERATGLAVTTTRQHFLHWDVRTTPALQEQAGLRADGTLGFNRNVGYRAGTSLPFFRFDLESGRESDLLELPLVVHDGALLRPDALELDTALARETIRRFVDAAAESGGVASLLFHPNNLARPEYLDLFRHAIEYGLERGGWFASLAGVDAWWRERRQRLEAV